MLKSISSGCEGYTFIELLIAVFILGIIITPMFTLFSVSSLSISNSGNHTLAANLCRNQLESLKAAGHESVIGLCNSYGNALIEEESLHGYPAFSRITRIQAYTPNTLPAGEDDSTETPLLLLIEVTVSWFVQDKEYSETVTTVLGPW